MSTARGRSSATTNLAATESNDMTVVFAADADVTSKPVHITDAQFEELIKKEGKPILVDFWAAWCGPCRRLAPTIDELAKEYSGKAVIAKLDTQKNAVTPRKFNIRGIPTVMIFQNGELKETLVGLQSKKKYSEALNKLITKPSSSAI
jgi:thioredoxin